jgi:hypothetical protein
MPKPIETNGFTPPADHVLGRVRRTVALAQLLATVGLALSTIVAVTVVSIGVARASVAGNVIDNEGSVFTVALVLGVVLFIAMSGLTAFTLPGHRPKKH